MCCAAAGVCPAFLLSAVLRGGKRQFGRKVAYCGSIRHRNPLLCCHGALARHLIKRFTLQETHGSSNEGLAAAEKERTSVRLTVAGYMRYLRDMVNKDQSDEQPDGNTSN
jgi:hypothetical protein